MPDVLAEGADTGEAAVQGVEEAQGGVIDEFGEKTASVIVSVTPAGHLVVQTRPVPGAPCPTYGKPYGKSQAQRSREWRAKRKEES